MLLDGLPRTLVYSLFILSHLRISQCDLNVKRKPMRETNNPSVRAIKKNKEDYDFNYNFDYRDETCCPPCVCNRNMDNVLTADCSKRKLKQVPAGLPASIISLNMSKNIIDEFNAASVSQYSQMTSLTVQSNSRLTKVIYVSAVNDSSQLTRLDLSHNLIQCIEEGSFRCLGNLRELTMAENKLMNISSEMFEGLDNLKSLNLSKNLLDHIDNNTFDNLKSLESLDLSRNKLTYSFKSIPLYSFEKLQNLKKLYLQGNVFSYQPYPIKALSKLSNLSHLYVDVNKFSKLGSQVKALKMLTSLILGGKQGYCNLRNITEDFLENTPYLKTFIVFGCLLRYINPLVYSSVKYLETLEISESLVDYDLYDAFDHLQGLVNSSLKTLRLTALSQTRYLCRTLGVAQARYLQYIDLEELNLSRNRIVLIGTDFVRLLPKTLKVLNLKDNKLTMKVFSIFSLHGLTELSEIYLDRQDDGMDSYIKSYLKQKEADRHANAKTDRRDEINITGFNNTPDTLELTTSKTSSYRLCEAESSEYAPTKKHHMPPNLKVVQGTRFILFGNRLFKINSSLTYITLNNNFLVSWGDGVLPEKIEKADISHNFAKTLSPLFFKLNNVLDSLNISNNILGEYFASDYSGQIFSNVSKLRFLDISANLVYLLRRHFLKGLTSLEILLVTNNKLQILNVSLSHMSRLRFMNFSRNSITWIDQTTRDDLDILASTHTVYLDLSFNPLPCTCEGLPVLQWMAYTNVNLVNQIYLKCQSEGGTMSNFGDLQQRMTQVRRACASRAIILVISISFTVCVILFTTLALVYRFRWNIRYLKNIALAKFVGFKPKNIRRDTFQYDAYVVYDDETVELILKDFVHELEVKRGHKLLLPDRDVMPGTLMTTAILSAVQNSYKTILVVTPDFYDGPYYEYAVKMATLEEMYGQREVLHLCLYQPTDHEEMSKDLLSIMHRNHYTEYPPEQDRTEDLVEHFWDQLSGCIQQKI